MQQRRGEQGFTLVELLIVIVVLGILASIVVFAVGNVRDEASSAAVVSEMRIVATANAAYKVRHGTDAPDIDALLREGLLSEAPSYVTLTDGVVTAITPTSTSTTAAPTTTTTSSTTTTTTAAPPTVRITVLTGATTRQGTSSNYRVVTTVTVADGSNVPVGGVAIDGTWSDADPHHGCTTDVAGTCAFTSNHSAPNTTTARTWTLSTVTKAGYVVGTHAKTTLACSRPAVVGTCS